MDGLAKKDGEVKSCVVNRMSRKDGAAHDQKRL